MKMNMKQWAQQLIADQKIAAAPYTGIPMCAQTRTAKPVWSSSTTPPVRRCTSAQRACRMMGRYWWENDVASSDVSPKGRLSQSPDFKIIFS